MIRGDCTLLPDTSLDLTQSHSPPSATSGWSGMADPPQSAMQPSLDHTKRKRNDSVSSPAPSIDNATATQNLLTEYLQNAEQCSSGGDKRPGRKPLQPRQPDDDEDPKVKRKVQNRAAQRAFRERKERYVRELEAKIHQIQTSHMQTTTQLTQENQYLRFVIHRLKTELGTIKGIPAESIPDLIPALEEWQQQQSLPSTPTATTSSRSADLAPFLTMSSQPVHVAPTPIAPAPPRTRPLAPSGPTPIAPRPATTQPAATVPSCPAPSPINRPVVILPQSAPASHHSQATVSYLRNTPPVLPISSASSSSSAAALYVRFSPQETGQDQFADASTFLTTSPIYEQQNLFGSNASGSSGSSQHGRSPPYMGSAAPSGSKEEVSGEKAVAAVDETESEATRIQTVWRRLNLYGRFTDFSFDQLCRVAQMADGNPAMQRTLGEDPRAEPSMEDWELDKLMHQIDPDHL